MSFMTWLGAPLFFLVDFFAVHVRSFAAIISCFGKALDIEIIQHISSHPITFLQSITFCPLLVHMGSLTALRHSETLSYASDPKIGIVAECGALFTLHDIRTPWNFNISKSYFSFNMSQMDQFQLNLFNVRKNANVFFCLSSRVK